MLAAALAGAGCHSCDTVEEHLAAGRHYEACHRADTHPDEEAVLQSWLTKNAGANATVVSHAAVAGLLGGPLKGYGTELSVFDLNAEVPGGVATFVESPRSAALADLVVRLPPLQRLQSPPRLPELRPYELLPVRHSGVGGGRGRDLVGDMFNAIFEVGGAVGAAVGAVVAVPVAVIGGLASAVGSIFSGIFGGGGGTPQVPLIDQVAPVERVTPVVIPSIDALLAGENLRLAQSKVDASYAAHISAVDGERARRLALIEDARLLAWGQCMNEGGCRIVAQQPPARTHLRTTFGDDEHRCVRELEVDVSAASLDETAKAPPPKSASQEDLDTKYAAANNVVRNLDGTPPRFALDHPATTTTALAPAEAIKADGDVKDLVCALNSKRGKIDAVARVTVGFDRLRTRTVSLGRVTKASFMVPGVHLKVGERVRLGVVDKAGDSLGGDVKSFDGALPIKLSSPAFSASCGAPNNDATTSIERAEQSAHAAVDVAVATRETKDDSLETSPQRWARLKKTRLAEARAEAAIAALAGEVGYGDPRVEVLAAQLP